MTEIVEGCYVILKPSITDKKALEEINNHHTDWEARKLIMSREPQLVIEITGSSVRLKSGNYIIKHIIERYYTELEVGEEL